MTHTPAVPSTTRRKVMMAVAAAAALMLVGATVSPVAADPPVVLANLSTADFGLVLVQSDPAFIQTTVTNNTAVVQSVGLGATTHDPSTVEYMWLSSWTDFAGYSRHTLNPGESYEAQIPNWSGMGLSFYSNIDASPTLIGSYRVAGTYLPVDITGTPTSFSLQVGYPVAIAPAVARAGESVRIQAQLGVNVPSADVRLVDPTLGLIGESWDWSTEGTTTLGTIPVASGLATGNITLPVGLTPGNYGLIVGDALSGWYPAGPRVAVPDMSEGGIVLQGFTVEAGAPRGTTPTGANVPVAPLDQYGQIPVSFSFGSVTSGGVTSVSTSSTGPAVSGFSLLAGANANFYELSTTASFTGQVQVCISYDPATVSAADQAALSLFHYSAGSWSDITTTVAPGLVCGLTASFSPFALGVATRPQYTFTGFLDPVSMTKVNTEFAGSIIPIRFRLGGNQGLTILAGGSPTSGISSCTVGARAASLQATASAVPAQLTYVKASGTYWYFWKTDKSWAGSCRQFVLTLNDGSVHTASFKFVKLTLGAVLRAIIKAT